MMVTGGCVGSTGGGIKVLRVAILWGLVKQEVRRLFYPSRAINRIVIDGSIVDRAEVHRVAAIFFSWILLLLIGGGVTALLSDLDGYTSFSGMFSALGNIGPSFMTVAEGATLHPLVKIVYIVGMLAGRLEILPVLLLFSPAAWKR
jgi:trk system potassium uptake protein TrkH